MKPRTNLELKDFKLIHTLVIMYCAFADHSGIDDAVLDIVLDRIKNQDFGLNDEQKNQEIISAMKWFTDFYQPSEFPGFREKLNELRLLPAERREIIIEDLRRIAGSFSQLTPRKIQLFESIVLNLGFDAADYPIGQF